MQGVICDEALLASPALVEAPWAALFREWGPVGTPQESRPTSAFSIRFSTPELPSAGEMRASRTSPRRTPSPTVQALILCRGPGLPLPGNPPPCGPESSSGHILASGQDQDFYTLLNLDPGKDYCLQEQACKPISMCTRAAP